MMNLANGLYSIGGFRKRIEIELLCLPILLPTSQIGKRLTALDSYGQCLY